MDLRKHFENLLDLIEIERDAEKEENKRELQRYPLHVREALGKTASRLHIVGEDVGVGNLPLLVLAPSGTPGELSPFHSMNQGDNILLTYPESSHLTPVDGTLYDVKALRITVAINGAVPDPLPEGNCQIDLLGSDATFRRMREALLNMHRTQRPDLQRTRDVLLGLKKPAHDKKSKVISFFNESLNPFQKSAVKKAMAAEDVAIIHGPPGTGKTTVLVEIMRQVVDKGKRVLASAPSNIAVDNMVEKLLSANVRMVRLGHPARIMEPLRHATLSAQVEEHPFMVEIKSKDDERLRLQKQLLRKQDRGTGLDSGEKWKLKGKIQQLWKEARNYEHLLQNEIIKNAQIVLGTHAGISRKAMRKKYDVVIMDEASQATEPLSWIPIGIGEKIIFAGDHCQLPPTLYSKKAAEGGLATTLFDQLMKSLPDFFREMLRVQYRMHEDIMGFSSREFYDGKLEADKSVKTHLACGLRGVKKTDLTSSPMIYIDTAGAGYDETWNELMESRENDGEVSLVEKIYGQLLEAGVQPKHMACLTPYGAQVKKLRLLNLDKEIEIGSVDSFQGREKEIVILSLVRSNPQGEVGFLGDTRRMNVAMTRARRLLIVIGDSATISKHPFYRDFLDYVDTLDAHRSAYEWIS